MTRRPCSSPVNSSYRVGSNAPTCVSLPGYHGCALGDFAVQYGSKVRLASPLKWNNQWLMTYKIRSFPVVCVKFPKFKMAHSNALYSSKSVLLCTCFASVFNSCFPVTVFSAEKKSVANATLSSHTSSNVSAIAIGFLWIFLNPWTISKHFVALVRHATFSPYRISCAALWSLRGPNSLNKFEWTYRSRY